MNFDANSTSYSNPTHIFDGSTSHHWKQTATSVKNRKTKKRINQNTLVMPFKHELRQQRQK